MAQVSKFLISKDVADRIFGVLIKSLIKIRSSKDANMVANDLFSPTERVMFSKRLAIAFCLMQGYQYREISKLLRVSTGTIRNINLGLKYGSNGYQTILGRIMQEEKLDDFFKGMAEKILKAGSYGKGSSAWRSLGREIQESKDKKAKQQF